MGVFSEAPLHGMTIRESADDGSDFTNAPSDYRRLFLGEDGQLHVKDSAGAVTDIGGAITEITDIPTAETDDTLVLAPDGAGGVEFRAEAASAVPTELSYVEFTSPVTISQTLEASADTIVTAGAIVFDGTTIALIEFFAPTARPANSTNALVRFWLYDGSSSIGQMGALSVVAAQNDATPVRLARRLTPSAASHTYSIRGTVSSGSGNANAGAGGAGNFMPGFIRITKVVT